MLDKIFLTSETNRPMLTIALLICVVLCSAKWRPNEGWRDDHFPYCHTEKNDQFLLVIGATTRQITLNNSLKIHISPKKGLFNRKFHLPLANKLLVFGGAFFLKEPCKKLKNHHSEASSLPLEGWDCRVLQHYLPIDSVDVYAPMVDFYSGQMKRSSKTTILLYLGGGFKHFLFSPLGKIPILTNIFQLGWNHQLDRIFKLHILVDFY